MSCDIKSVSWKVGVQIIGNLAISSTEKKQCCRCQVRLYRQAEAKLGQDAKMVGKSFMCKDVPSNITEIMIWN